MAISEDVIEAAKADFEKRRKVEKPFGMDIRHKDKVLASVKFRCTPDDLADFQTLLAFIMVPNGLCVYFVDLPDDPDAAYEGMPGVTVHSDVYKEFVAIAERIVDAAKEGSSSGDWDEAACDLIPMAEGVLAKIKDSQEPAHA